MAMDRPDKVLYFSDVSRLRVTMAGRLSARRGWRWDHPGGLEDSLIVWFVTQGSGSLDVGGERLVLAPDTMLFLRMWEPLAARQDDRQPFAVLWASIEGLDHRGRVCDLSKLPVASSPPLVRRPHDAAFVLGVLERLVRPFAAGSGLNDESDAWLMALLREVAEAPGEDDAARAAFVSARPAIDAIVRDIVGDPARDWSVAAMARRLHCSPDHFTRTFRAIVGQTPQRFVIGARIAAAKGLLRTSSLSVTAIAEALGYSDVYFFSKQFLRETGSTPSGFRKGAR